MPIMPLKVLTEALKNFEDISNEIAKVQKMMNYLLEGNLDFENIRVKGIVAENIDVDKLSAISADIGEITAGIIRGIQIFGTYIATAEGTFPRAEMNVTNNLIAALQDANNYMAMQAQGFGSVPALSWFALGTIVGFLNRSAGGTTLGTFDGESLNFQPSGDLQIGGQNGVGGGVWASSAPGVPADTFIAFTKGLRTS